MSDKDQANIKNLHGGGELRETGSKKMYFWLTGTFVSFFATCDCLRLALKVFIQPWRVHP